MICRLLPALLWLPLLPTLADDGEANSTWVEHSPTDFAETPGIPLPSPFQPQVAGPIASTTMQATGSLSGRIIFTSGGHGWTWGGSSWVTQRGVTWEMLEDYGNLDQMNFFVHYCFNAGATVVAMRPIGFQTNEVVLDNDSAGVTFAGFWTNSTSTIFFGSAGDVPYRFAPLNATETATATYTPTIPAAGFYPVYTWVRVGSDRGDQLYRIRHTGGESPVRVPHHMVGSGWVYLGTYHFNAGANANIGSVVVSNLRSTTNGVYVFADALRFGNGMGTINRGGGVSGYPREDECARYWVQAGLGQGQSSSLYDGSSDDASDNVGTPPRMAAEMNREAAGSMTKRLFIGFHSNACGCGANPTARGCTGLYNDPTLSTNVAANSDTPNQKRLAEIVSTNLNSTLKQVTVPPFEVGWTNNRASTTYARSDYAFGEINNNYINDEFDATIIEVAFHDNQFDALLLRDPKMRNWIGRATYQAAVRYFNLFDTNNPVPLSFLPEPPGNPRALAVSNGIAISWSAPVAEFSTGPATSYLVYLSTNGYGFGNPLGAPAPATTLTFTNLPADVDFYFRVTALNAAGESMPSETVGCRRSSNPAQSRVLFVNAFDRYDRTTNLRMGATAQTYTPPGNSGATERVFPRANNSFDYVVPHGKAISAFGFPFDSCQRRAVTNNLVALTNYQIVVWSAGQSLTNTFRALERNVVTNYQNRGGHLFVSGADIAWDLDRTAGPVTADRAFLNSALHADLGADANNNSASYAVTPAPGSIFAGAGNATFDNGAQGIYWVQNPDALTPTGPGASAALNYAGGNGGIAGIQYDGSAGGGRVVYFGFPFETITDATVRSAYMADVLRFCSKRPRIESFALRPDHRPKLLVSGEPGLTYSLWASSEMTNWTALGNLLTTNGVADYTDTSVLLQGQRFYRLLLVP